MRILLLFSALIFLTFGPLLAQGQNNSVCLIQAFDAQGRQLGSGTAFFVTSNGTLVTRRSYFVNSETAKIVTLDGKSYDIATVLGEDKALGLVKLAINNKSNQTFKTVKVSRTLKWPASGTLVHAKYEKSNSSLDVEIENLGKLSPIGSVLKTNREIPIGGDGAPIFDKKGAIIGIVAAGVFDQSKFGYVIPASELAEIKSTKIKYKSWAKKMKLDDSYLQGVTAMTENNPERGFVYLQQASKAQPNNVKLLQLLSSAKYKKDVFTPYGVKTQTVAENAEVVIPENEALAKSGFLKMKAKDFQGAENDFNKALGLGAPDSLYYYVGHTRFEQQKYSSALIAFEKAEEKGYDKPKLYSERGTIYYSKEDTEKVIKDLSKIADTSKDFNVFKMLAYSQYKNGDTEAALPNLEKAFDLGLEEKEGFLYASNIYYKSGKTTQAMKYRLKANQTAATSNDVVASAKQPSNDLATNSPIKKESSPAKKIDSSKAILKNNKNAKEPSSKTPKKKTVEPNQKKSTKKSKAEPILASEKKSNDPSTAKNTPSIDKKSSNTKSNAQSTSASDKQIETKDSPTIAASLEKDKTSAKSSSGSKGNAKKTELVIDSDSQLADVDSKKKKTRSKKSNEDQDSENMSDGGTIANSKASSDSQLAKPNTKKKKASNKKIKNDTDSQSIDDSGAIAKNKTKKTKRKKSRATKDDKIENEAIVSNKVIPAVNNEEESTSKKKKKSKIKEEKPRSPTKKDAVVSTAVQQNIDTPEVAVATVNDAASIGSEDKHVQLVLGDKALEQENFKEAIRAYTKAISLGEDDDASVFNNRGMAYKGLSKYTDAINDFNKAIELDHKSPVALEHRGEAKFLKGDYEGAIHDISRLENVENIGPELFYYKAESYAATNKNNLAASYYDKAKRAGNRSEDIPEKIRVAKVKAEENGENITSEESGNSKTEMIEALLEKAEKALMREDNKTAIAALDEAVLLDPENPDLYYNRAYAKEQIEDFEGARIDFNKVLNINPDDAEAHYYRANAKISLGDLESALYDLDKAVKLDASNGDFLMSRGNVKWQLKMKDTACDDWESAQGAGQKQAKFYLKHYCKSIKGS